MHSADDNPVAVMQGYGFDLAWQELNEAAIAIHHGAHWVATNIDPTRPTDRGLVPGNGAAVDSREDGRTSGAGGGRQALSAAAGRHRRADSALITRCSSGIGSTPTLQGRSTPVWTACSCSPVPIALQSCSTPHPENDQPLSGKISVRYCGRHWPSAKTEANSTAVRRVPPS